MTKAEIMAALDAAGIEYSKKATRQALEALLPKEGQAQPEPTSLVDAVVVRPFQDMYTLHDYAVGERVSVTAERFAEMNAGKERVRRA